MSLGDQEKACSYVADRIRRALKKGDEKEPVTPMAQRSCALKGTSNPKDAGQSAPQGKYQVDTSSYAQEKSNDGEFQNGHAVIKKLD